MDKSTLHKIFEKPYEHQDWLDVLQSVFSAKQIYSQPKSIILPGSEKYNEAFELGNFTTTDDRIIGLYRVNVNADVWLERNKVSLRELLRNIYKYDVDGAIVVFVQEDKWRLSFISEVKMLNEEGEIVKQATEPKRYTYLLGTGEKVRTPSDRLSKLSGKALSLQDILSAFSVEALNEEFYKIVQSYFYKLVGGKIGKDKKITDYGNGILKLPDDDRNDRQEFAVRLIGRTVFCWFLKMKKSDAEVALLPEHLLSSDAVKNNINYYHTILERLFFQTLNTPMHKRINNLPEGAEVIPFLNGGLFEPNNDDFFKPANNGINEYNFGIIDDWFLSFFKELEKYNFTIDENSVAEIEVSVDPEMLGRIFENLLAEIDPESGETARKATGSFYTPREIVDYMVTESLVQYLYHQTSIEKHRLSPIFKLIESTNTQLTESEKNCILDCLDKVKILDPACGSGAFPMGVLQKIVQALQKLDPEALWWKKRQIDRIDNPIVKRQLREKLASSSVEYARKIGIIQNSLYGVDIQPIAAEISKLRCFLSLIVDENIDESLPNRGVEPLPNLEFKFVTADTLVDLPTRNGQSELNKRGKKSSAELEAELNDVRQEYIQSFGEDKKVLKQKFKETQKQLFDQQGLFGEVENNRYHKISNWNPFGNEKSDWFDPKWMFGINIFNIIIGNPPYGGTISNELKLSSQYKETKFGGKESYKFFFNRSIKMLQDNFENKIGVLAFITSDSFIEKETFIDLRTFMLNNSSYIKVLNLGDSVFEGVNLPTSVTLLTASSSVELSKFSYLNVSHLNKNSEKISYALNNNFKVINPENDLKKRFTIFRGLNVKVPNSPLIELYDQVMGVKVYQQGKGKPKQTNYEIDNDIFVSESPKNDVNWFRFIDSGVKRYNIVPKKKYINYGEWLAEPRQIRFFNNPKIILREVVNPTPFATYMKETAIVKNTNAVIVQKNKDYPLLYLLPLLNSKIFNYYLSAESPKSNNKSFPSITSKLLKFFPIPESSLNEKLVFVKISQIMLFICSLDKTQMINSYISNDYVIQLFDEIIDAMSMELYFKDEFELAGIEFIKYVDNYFESIDGKSELDKVQIINSIYQKLRDVDNEIRNNLKLMDIKLADIVMPIKTAK
ncbi:Eco57I restriction-modification methylase domain-containing protein [Flavobacterium sp. UBA4854]|uniref:Eco57I restriction-modification methylase domain-containing protein n=1 Tax=Flavobacterium sp. UBA4854 TaxID=1946548 RepID=UPI00257DBB27|nr:TaqI-like C-terminal specificity domain-containing protein [Flavobacterium sp. UBA4854]